MNCIKCGGVVKETGTWSGACVKCNKKYTLTECYSRVVGYIRPVAQWNDGKQAEFADRKLFNPGQTSL